MSGALALAQPRLRSDGEAVGWPEQFAQEVDRRLDVPEVEQQRYIVLLRQALEKEQTPLTGARAFVVVDRSR